MLLSSHAVSDAADAALLRAIGARARERRVALGLSRQEVADRAGMNPHYVGGIERGERNVGTLNLARLAQALDYADLGEFLSGLGL